MIEFESQNELFELISNYLKKDIALYAFGGTAMMFYGYKDTTKDIDLLFDEKESLKEFIRIIKILGYKEASILGMYSKDKKSFEKPLVFTRGDERFDLFLKKIFNFELKKSIKERFFEKHDFKKNKFCMTLYVISKEDIILLKSVTDRERDFEDIVAIVKKDNSIDWNIIIEEAIHQKDKWIVLSLEETMQKLRKFIFIPKKFFNKLYRK